jgi:hypothetical protein
MDDFGTGTRHKLFAELPFGKIQIGHFSSKYTSNKDP